MQLIYRPIFILSCFSKILEKIVYDRTTKVLNDCLVISPTQSIFRSDFSTEHAVLDIVNTCDDNRKEIVLWLGVT